MNNLPIHAAAVLVCFLAVAAQSFAAELPAAGEVCANCHHDNGVSDDPEVPIIAGASSFFLENQLIIYSEEARPCEAGYFEEKSQEVELSASDHCALAKSLSDDDKLALAEYFASRPFSAAQQEFDAALAERGASLHAAGCERCHTESGGLALDDAGILAGQWKQYLAEQFEYYEEGKRWQPEKMQPEMDKLGAEDVYALVEFYAREGLK